MAATRVGLDPTCRYSRQRQHACIRRDGKPVFIGDTCWAEASAQVAEQGAVLHAAEQVVA